MMQQEPTPENLPTLRILAGGCLLGYGTAAVLSGSILYRIRVLPGLQPVPTLAVWLLLATGISASLVGLFLSTTPSGRMDIMIETRRLDRPQAIADSTLLIALVAGLTTLGGLYLAASGLLQSVGQAGR